MNDIAKAGITIIVAVLVLLSIFLLILSAFIANDIYEDNKTATYRVQGHLDDKVISTGICLWSNTDDLKSDCEGVVASRSAWVYEDLCRLADYGVEEAKTIISRWSEVEWDAKRI